MKNYFYPEERIAIVGMGALLPDANNVDSFWNNILIYIIKINKNDKTYTRMVAPPAVAEHMDPNQHVAIYCVDQALQSLANSNINRERTAVIMNIGAQYNKENLLCKDRALKKRNWMR